MSRLVIRLAGLGLIVSIAACQDAPPPDEVEAIAPPAAETAQEDAAEADDGPNQMEQFMAVGRLDAQRGLITKTEAATPGYVLFNPLKSATTYLIDMNGQVVHTWTSELGISGGLYLKDNGNLLRSARDPSAPVFAGGGQGGAFQEFTWDGELVWEYFFSSQDYLPHHDIELLPNGNFLGIAWESKTPEEAAAEGRDPAAITEVGLWPDWIFEMRPVGSDDAEIVWEWRLWDHLVQDFDETKDNYGVVADHPELLDVNLADLGDPITKEALDARKAMDFASTNSSLENWGADLYHMNAIDYHAGLDQIAISLPGINEIFIIDHSTTSDEAAGHGGGRWGRGGDILYRWGNPANYGLGDESDQRLGGQHDVQWIPAGYPGAGNLTVFNNVAQGVGPARSSVIELETPLTDAGYALSATGYGPDAPAWEYMADEPMTFFAPFVSSAHRMQNGHTMIAEGPAGRFFEVDPAGNVVWEYLTPYAGYVTNPDGTSPQPVGPLVYATFRATHIPADHPALAGRNLEPQDPQPPAYVPPQRPQNEN